MRAEEGKPDLKACPSGREFVKMVCRKCCVRGGVRMYRCRWDNGAAGVGYAVQKREKERHT